MNNQEIVQQLQKLELIRPDKAWAQETKKEILGYFPLDLERYKGIFSRWSRVRWSVLVPLAFTTMAAFGLFLYRNSLSLTRMEADIESDNQALQTIVEGLKEVRPDLLKVTNSLKEVEEPEKIVNIQETLDSAVESGEKLVQAARKMAKAPKAQKREGSGQALAAIASAEEVIQGVKETYLEKQKSLAQRLIDELESKSLTEEQAQFLEEARKNYEEGRFDEALIKALEMSNKVKENRKVIQTP